jgi:ubiquinone/menaquinone biosynthesis C-methylase UbiE
MGFYADKIFPWILDKIEPKEMSELRTRTLQEVTGDVLEIGLGTGGNLPYYPKTIKSLTVAEPSSGMHERAKNRAIETGHSVEWFQTKGECLPFEEKRFDTVVTSQLLCSVENVEKVLKESFRVLKPGGQYRFFEHVISKDSNIRKWQYRLNRIHKIIGCGCELIKDIEQSIRDSEFEIKELHQISLNQKIYPCIQGIAIKPI